MAIRPTAFAAIVGASFLVATVANGQLRPDQVLVLYNTKNPHSQELAVYYADARQIEAKHVVGLPMPDRESISAAQYRKIRNQLRSILSGEIEGDAIRAIAVIYGVPLRIGAPKPTREEKARRPEVTRRLHAINSRIAGQLSQLATSLGSPHAANFDKQSEVADLKQSYAGLRESLHAKLREARAGKDAAREGALLDFVVVLEGAQNALPLIEASKAEAEASSTRFAAELYQMHDELKAVHGEFLRDQEKLSVVRGRGVAADGYDAALDLAERWQGLFGAAEWMAADLARLAGEECHAAFDSELSLALWPPYSPYRWQPNLLNPTIAAQSSDATSARTLMVSRIDAPSPAIAKRMIDDAIAAEAAGLVGKFYIDARGIKKHDLYRDYDDNLFRLDKFVRERTKISVVLDRRSRVFPIDSCPDTALYCGWYSVANYVPAFKFNRGAIAYHIASFELRSLRDSRKKYWCPGLLRDGVAATLGATSEPYLHAFPPPSRFFALILSGRFTLVECFYLSKPFNSWQLALLGDPLYRPFGKNPALDQAPAAPRTKN